MTEPTTDQTALRDRIAEAIIRSDGVPSQEFVAKLHWAAALREADAVLAVLPAPADRAALIAATARACAEHLRDRYADTWTADAARSLELNAARIERGEPTALLRRMAAEARGAQQDQAHACGNCEGIDPDSCLNNPDRPADTGPKPRRGDAFEAWLKAQRDEHPRPSHAWFMVDCVLDTYRLHADTGTPLSEHVCEGQAVGDCEHLEQPAAAQQPKEA